MFWLQFYPRTKMTGQWKSAGFRTHGMKDTKIVWEFVCKPICQESIQRIQKFRQANFQKLWQIHWALFHYNNENRSPRKIRIQVSPVFLIRFVNRSKFRMLCKINKAIFCIFLLTYTRSTPSTYRLNFLLPYTWEDCRTGYRAVVCQKQKSILMQGMY